MRAISLLLSLLPSLLSAQGSLTGRVNDERSGKPLPNVSIRFFSMLDPAGKMDTLTGPDGRFEFPNVPAAKAYMLILQKPRYVQTTFPRPAWFNLLEIGPAGLSGLELKLMPQSVLAGVLTDPTGEPIERVTVSAVRRRQINGQVVHLPVGAHSYTNDLGEFRLPLLSAGEYTLSADRREIPTTYSLGHGELRESLTVVLPATLHRQVSGRLSGPRQTVIPKTVYTLGRLDIVATIKSDGTFTFPGLPPGTHTLVATSDSDSSSSCEIATVTVADADLASVVLQAPPTFTLTGRLRIEGPGAPAPSGHPLSFLPECS